MLHVSSVDNLMIFFMKISKLRYSPIRLCKQYSLTIICKKKFSLGNTIYWNNNFPFQIDTVSTPKTYAIFSFYLDIQSLLVFIYLFILPSNGNATVSKHELNIHIAYWIYGLHITTHGG